MSEIVRFSSGCLTDPFYTLKASDRVLLNGEMSEAIFIRCGIFIEFKDDSGETVSFTPLKN